MKGWSQAALIAFAGVTVVVVAKVVAQTHDDSVKRENDSRATSEGTALRRDQDEGKKKPFGCYTNCMACDLACGDKQDSRQKQACSSACYSASERCCNGVGEVPASRGCGCMDMQPTSRSRDPLALDDPPPPAPTKAPTPPTDPDAERCESSYGDCAILECPIPGEPNYDACNAGCRRKLTTCCKGIGRGVVGEKCGAGKR